MLAQAKVPYTYVDIHRDAPAAALIRSLNQGNASVPTLVFPDGSTLTEPSATELKRKLETMGYRVGLLAWLVGNAIWIITSLVILYGVLRFLEIF